MYHMYQLDAFTQSCPADQDIINHYKLQQVTIMQFLARFPFALDLRSLFQLNLQYLETEKHIL